MYWFSECLPVENIPLAINLLVPLTLERSSLFMKLYVGNLSFSTTEGDLTALFSQVGTVQSVRIMTDRDTGKSRGFGFVELADRSEGEAAISRFNSHTLDGRPLKVNEAQAQENRGSRGGGGGGGRGGGRGGGSRFGGNRDRY